MAKINRLGTVAQVCMIVVISTSIGVVWNLSLLTRAWRGELTGQVRSPAPEGAGLPLPLGLLQIKELYDAKQAVIVDARSAASFAEGHIAGAITLPLDEARRNPAHPFKQKFSPDSVIIAYCNGFSCRDSMDLGKILIHAGYVQVYIFEGGFPQWRDAGYPVETGGR